MKGPALRLRAKLFLIGESREPQWEGREAGLPVHPKLAGQGCSERNIVDSRKRSERSHNGKNDLPRISL